MMSSSIFDYESFARKGYMVRLAYVDITEDLVSGILLGQIVYWFMPDDQGKSKLRISKHGEMWLAKGREDWYEEIRITPKQYDRAIKILVDKEFVEVQRFKFNGAPTIHIKLNIEKVNQRVKSILTFGENGNSPLGKMEFDQTVTSLTEITSKITSETTLNNHSYNNTASLSKMYQTNFGMINQEKFDALVKWSEDESFELVMAAMKKAALKPTPTINLVEYILKDWVGHNVHTVEAAEAYEKQRINNYKKGAPPHASNKDNDLRYSQKGEFDYGF